MALSRPVYSRISQYKGQDHQVKPPCQKQQASKLTCKTNATASHLSLLESHDIITDNSLPASWLSRPAPTKLKTDRSRAGRASTPYRHPAQTLDRAKLRRCRGAGVQRASAMPCHAMPCYVTLVTYTMPAAASAQPNEYLRPQIRTDN